MLPKTETCRAASADRHRASTIMNHDASAEYLRNAVMTATPEQLHLMLYDGAIRFARQAREALVAGDLENACEKLLKAQRIITEMKNGLRPEVNPSLCDQLSGLYNFIYWRLVEANTRHEPECIDEALQILEHQRETWKLLIEKVREAAPAVTAHVPAKPAERQPLSVEV